MGARRIAAALALMLAVAVSGCTHTVPGASRAAGPASPRGAADLGAFLLDATEVAEVVGADDLSVLITSDQLSDNSLVVSDPACLASVYQVEEQVYGDAGWTDVVHQVLAEPVGDISHWVEQSVVALGSEELAQTFFDETVSAWSDCIGKVIDAEDEFRWRIKGVGIMGYIATQRYDDDDGVGGGCDHTLGVTGRYAVEVTVCGMEPTGESVELAQRVVDRIG